MKAFHLASLSAVTSALILFTAPTNAAVTVLSGPVFNPATGHNYYLLSNSDWTDAQAEALTLGGNLATINDSNENAWVTQEFAGAGGIQRNLWIGLNAAGFDGGDPASYSWVSGDPSIYRNWATGEPNFSDQYAQIVGSTNATAFGQWNNVSDNLTDGYASLPAIPNFGVVEVVPEPAAYLLTLLGGLLFCRPSIEEKMTD